MFPEHWGNRIALLVVTVKHADAIRSLLRDGHQRSDVAKLLGCSKATVTYHARRLNLEAPKAPVDQVDWNEVQQYYDEGYTIAACCLHFGFSNTSFDTARKRGLIRSRDYERAIPLDIVLVDGRPTNTNNLKIRLIREGLLEYRCAWCELDTWREQKLVLQLDHINGRSEDNRLENLRLLCPNCHSQTPTFCGKNKTHRRFVHRPGWSSPKAQRKVRLLHLLPRGYHETSAICDTDP